MVVDFAMNEACAAGTGSFLEEAALETLGVEMAQIFQDFGTKVQLFEGQDRIQGILFVRCRGQVGEVGAVWIGEHGGVVAPRAGYGLLSVFGVLPGPVAVVFAGTIGVAGFTIGGDVDATAVPVGCGQAAVAAYVAAGAAGAIEGVATILALQNGVIPPTANFLGPDPECDLDYVPNHAREAPVRHALNNSFGFGGQNVTLCLSHFDG